MSRHALIGGYGSSLGGLNGRQNLAKMGAGVVGQAQSKHLADIVAGKAALQKFNWQGAQHSD